MVAAIPRVSVTSRHLGSAHPFPGWLSSLAVLSLPIRASLNSSDDHRSKSSGGEFWFM